MHIMNHLVDRWAKHAVEAALRNARIVSVYGPRQSGKTTLIRQFEDSSRPYFDLDDDLTRAGIDMDISDFAKGNDKAIIDEVHRLPYLVLSLKSSVDVDQSRGRFIICSSLSQESLSKASDSLAGRSFHVNLLPLSYAEIRSAKPNFLEILESGKIPAPCNVTNKQLFEWIVKGGYPASALVDSLGESRKWIGHYLSQVVRNDIIEQAGLRRGTDLLYLLKCLAESSGRLFSINKMHSLTGHARPTIVKIIDALTQTNIISLLRPHHDKLQPSIRKRPKLEFIDTGLLSWLLDFELDDIGKHGQYGGKLVEAFAYSELQKQHVAKLDMRSFPRQIEHNRDKVGKEIDFVVPIGKDEVIAVEIKASVRLRPDDYETMRKFATAKGKKLRFGIVLYLGKKSVSLDHMFPKVRKGTMWALPMSCLVSGKAMS